MASGYGYACVGETGSEEATPLVYEGISDSEGIQIGEESELDRLLFNESKFEVSEKKIFSYDATKSRATEHMFFNCGKMWS